MNYIYDIYLNFNNTLIDFFDWNKNDKLTHIKKTPIFKINSNNFKILCSNKVKVDTTTLNQIENKTEVWKNKRGIKYCCLFCTDSSIICIKFDKNGISSKKSFLFVDEDLEILTITHKLKEKNIKFKSVKKDNILYKTRLEYEIDNYIHKKLYKLNDEQLKYIYYECFNKFTNKYKMILDIKNINKNSIKYEKLYNVLKLISSIKK